MSLEYATKTSSRSVMEPLCIVYTLLKALFTHC
jgi:hypothetical protein